jgi:hypothetical protein
VVAQRATARPGFITATAPELSAENHWENQMTSWHPSSDPAEFERVFQIEGGLVNASDAARLCGVTRQRMMKLHETGGHYTAQFTPFRFFGRAYFSMTEIRNFRDSRRQGRPVMTLMRRFHEQDKRAANATVNLIKSVGETHMIGTGAAQKIGE